MMNTTRLTLDGQRIRLVARELERAIRPAAWTVLLLIAAIQAWGFRHAMNPDGIAYLDLARAVARGDWISSINGYWSPVYPWLLGLGLKIARPSAYWEFTVAHIVNFFIFVAALIAFEFFLQQTLRARSRFPNSITLPDWACKLVGYSFFGWSTLVMIGLRFVTPDLAVAAVVYVVGGILVRWLYDGSPAPRRFALLGGVLALGFLTKAAMFPLGLVLLASALLARSRIRVREIGIALFCFAIVSGPFLIALREQKGRFSIGETGKLNYAWFVNNVRHYTHWHGEPIGSGKPVHATKILQRDPPTYSFSEPVRGTYPIWYDPSYWHEGLQNTFSVQRQLRRFGIELQNVPWIFGDLLPLIVLGGLVLRRKVEVHRRVLVVTALPALAAIAMYLLVHIEQRFLGGFVGVLLVGSMLALRPNTMKARNAVLATYCVLALLLATRTLQSTFDAAEALADQVAIGRDANEAWKTASTLHEAGLGRGQNVAFIGDGFFAYWAHVGQFRIVGESPASLFWSTSRNRRNASVRALMNSGIGVILADDKFGCVVNEGWQHIANTHLCIRTHSAVAD